MPEEINQDIDQNLESNPDETAASLAFATNLRERLMRDMMANEQLEQPQTQEMGGTSVPNEKDEVEEAPEKAEHVKEIKPEPKEQEDIKEEDTEKEDTIKEIKDMRNDLKEFKGNIEKSIKDKFGELTKTIRDALKED